MHDYASEYEMSRPRYVDLARTIVVKHAFYLEVFQNRRIPMEKKLSYFIESLPRVLADFGINDA
jgi:hypothetical protein